MTWSITTDWWEKEEINPDLLTDRMVLSPVSLHGVCLTLFIAESFTSVQGFKCVPAETTATEEAFTPVTGAVVEESGNPRVAAAVIYWFRAANWWEKER